MIAKYFKIIKSGVTRLGKGPGSVASRSACAVFSLITLLTLSLTACSDVWDEHYDTAAETDGTLWEALSSLSEASNFARVISAVGYDTQLGSQQSLSVFAPTDAALTWSEADSLIGEYQQQKSAGVKDADNTVIRQFVQNHISLYKHPVSSITDDSISMMNGKYELLTSSTIGNVALASTGDLYGNGILFTVNSQIPYFPNVLEQLRLGGDMDSVYNFINSYSKYEFNASKSVAGEIVDGQTVYLDSVTTLYNALLTYNGYINAEDSSYWMLAPTNSEWDRMIEEYAPYFNYDNTVNHRDSLQTLYSHLFAFCGGIFNRTDNPDAALRDSAVSTRASAYAMREGADETDPAYVYYQPFAADGIFTGTTQIECSNGVVRRASDYRIKPEKTFLREIKVEAESIMAQDTILNAEDPLTTITVPSTSAYYDKISGNSFVKVVPENTSVNPTVAFSVENVLSNVGYDIYIVFAPALAEDSLADEEDRLPNYLRVFVGSNGQDGLYVSERVGSTFKTTPDIVDTMLVASDYKFKTCSYGLTEGQVKIQLVSIVSARLTSEYSRTFRIDCFILKPHEE